LKKLAAVFPGMPVERLISSAAVEVVATPTTFQP